ADIPRPMASELRAVNDQSRLRGRIVLAVCLWIGMFAWTNTSSFQANILEDEPAPRGKDWGLYTAAAQGICDVRYYDMNQRGAPIERWKLLGYERLGDVPDR